MSTEVAKPECNSLLNGKSVYDANKDYNRTISNVASMVSCVMFIVLCYFIFTTGIGNPVGLGLMVGIFVLSCGASMLQKSTPVPTEDCTSTPLTTTTTTTTTAKV